jgi:hypothetical protein
MFEPPVVCVDVTPRAFNEFCDKPLLLCKVLTNEVVFMSYEYSVLEKGANVFTVFTGTSSGLRFGFFYADVSHVDESLNAALTRCMRTQTDKLFLRTAGATREDRWGDLDVPFCNLLAGSATERPADETVRAGATLLPAIKCGAGKVLDYVREDGQTVAVVVDTGVLSLYVGAAVDRAIRDGTCVAMHCREDVHPCDKTSVFWLALEALRVWTWTKTPVPLPEVPAQKSPATAPAQTVKVPKEVQNMETPEVIEYRFYRDELPATRFETVVTPWAEPPHRNEQTGVTQREEQSTKWKQAGWKCSTTTTEHTWTHPVTLVVFKEDHTVES